MGRTFEVFIGGCVFSSLRCVYGLKLGIYQGKLCLMGWGECFFPMEHAETGEERDPDIPEPIFICDDGVE